MSVWLLLAGCGVASLTGVIDGEMLAQACRRASAVEVTGDVLVASSVGEEVACLERVSGAVVVYPAADIRQFDAFPALVAIGGDLVLKQHQRLERLSGFGALEALGGDLVLESLPSLEHIDGFGALSAIGGALYLEDAPELVQVGELGLRTVGGKIQVFDTGLVDLGWAVGLESSGPIYLIRNVSMQSLTGLETLSVVAAEPEAVTLRLDENGELVDLQALSGVDWTGGEISLRYIRGDISLDWLAGTSELASLELGFADLTRLTGLEALSRIGTLFVHHCDLLPDLAGLEALEEVEMHLAFSDNPGLDDVSALESGLNRVGGNVEFVQNGSALTCDELLTVFSEVDVGGGTYLEDGVGRVCE